MVAFQQALHDLVDGGRHRALQLLETLFLLGEDDARDDVVAIAELTIIVGGVANDLTLGNVDQLDPDGGGADINGKRVVTLGEVAGFHIHEVREAIATAGVIDGSGHLVMTFTQHPSELLQLIPVNGERSQRVLPGESLFQTG